jgi:hypothetical protein
MNNLSLKLFTLLFIFTIKCLGQTKVRHVGYLLNITNPEYKSTFYTPTDLNLTFKLTNIGPDTIYNTDSLFFSNWGENDLIIINKFIGLSKHLSPYDTLYFNFRVKITGTFNNEFYNVQFLTKLYNNRYTNATLKGIGKDTFDYPSNLVSTQYIQKVFGSTMPRSRKVDISPSILNPIQGDSIITPKRYPISISIKNNGPDEMLEHDFFRFIVRLNTFSISDNNIQLNKVLKAGDSIIFNINPMIVQYGIDTVKTTKQNLCVEVLDLHSLLKHDSIVIPRHNLNYMNDKQCLDVFYMGIPPSRTNIENNLSTSSINIYPNPNNGSFKIENSLFEINDIKIYDIIGKSTPFNWNKINNEIEIPKGKSGIYFISISTNKVIVYQKLIIN